MQGDSAHASGNDSQGGAEGKQRATVTSLQAQAEQTTLAVRTLVEAVQEIKKVMKSLKRKKEEEDGVPAKKTCSGENPMIPSVQKPGSSREDDQSSDMSEQQNWENIDSDEDLNEFMEKSNDNDSQEMDSLAELRTF